MDQPAPAPIVYQFEHFRLDKAGRQLIRQGADGETVPVLIGARALDILLVLVERSGQVVSKTQIMDAVWPGLAVEDGNLTVQISALRRAVDDGREGPSLIRTVHGRGYLLTAAATNSIALSLLSPLAGQSPTQKPVRMHIRSDLAHLPDLLGRPSAIASPPNSQAPVEGPSVPKQHVNRVEKLPGSIASDLSQYSEAFTTAGQSESDEGASELPPPERRQLTIMACELIDLAGVSSGIDLEDLREMTTACHLRCTEVIERHGGYVANYSIDGALAYFGYLRTTEHDVERAVQAGLALVEAMPKLSTETGMQLHARVGIATALRANDDETSTPGSLDPKARKDFLIHAHAAHTE